MNNDIEYGLTAKLGLENLCNHCMEYYDDYDWDESPCGEYYPVSQDTLDEWSAPINILIEKDTEKVLIMSNGKLVCPACKNTKTPEKIVHYMSNFKYCPQCGQKLKTRTA